MTTSLEGTTTPALTIPVDQTVAASPQPEPTPAPQPEPESDDVDDIELREAKAAAQAEEAAANAPPQPAAAEGTTPSPAPAAAPAAPAAAQEPPTEPQPAAPAKPRIPKARFDEVSAKAAAEAEARAKAEQDAAYWRGRAEALAQSQGAAPAPGQPQAPAAPAAAPQTPEQRLASVRDAKLVIARKFDDGEMTMVDYERQRDELDSQAQVIREESLLAKVPSQPQAPAQSGGDALYLEKLTAELEEKHPWVQVFEAVGNDADWAYIEVQARASLTERGIPLNQGALSTYHLREEMGRLADEFGPGLLTKRAQAKGVTLPGQPAAATAAALPPQPTPQPAAPPAGARPTLSSVAAARADKLATAASAPPRLDAMHGAVGESGVSESQIDGMSDDDIGNLPDAVRRKARGIL